MSTIVHTVTVEFSQMNYEDAATLRDIINEMGFNSTLSSRIIDPDKVETPMRETRLGWIVLHIMSKRPKYIWTIDEVADELVAYRYNRLSAGGVLSKLAHQRDIMRLGHGRYRALRPAEGSMPELPPHANGNAA